MSRFARAGRVFFFEEPVFGEYQPALEVRVDDESGVQVITPQLPARPYEAGELDGLQAKLLHQLMEMARIESYFTWYYTPMALGFSKDLTPSAIIYDCMDELSAFKGAPPALRERERELFQQANLVFTGGQTLYEAKRAQHPDVHAFPSSVDVNHFGQARHKGPEPTDQASIPHPRIGYCGVIDERMDLDLLRGVAQLRPDWHLVMIGPVVKIDPASLPKLPNIHYLGSKDYKQLPHYMAHWDAAMLPFALNESTRFISPTKTPEYLAAGVPSVSTSIRDVVRPYGEMDLVGIADTPDQFVACIEEALATNQHEWLPRVDAFLKNNSWDTTWSRMMDLIDPLLNKREAAFNTASQSNLKGTLHV